MSVARHINLMRTLRLLSATIVSYVFANGLMALMGTGLPHLGMVQTEAVLLGVLVGCLMFPVTFIWIIATRYFLSVSAGMLAAAIAMVILAPKLVSG